LITSQQFSTVVVIAEGERVLTYCAECMAENSFIDHFPSALQCSLRILAHVRMIPLLEGFMDFFLSPFVNMRRHRSLVP
jgi:hypothetical protein